MTLFELQERLKTDFPNLPIAQDCAYGKTKGLILFNERVISIAQINKELARANGKFNSRELLEEDHLSLSVKFVSVSETSSRIEKTVINLSIYNDESYKLLHNIIEHSNLLL